MSGTGEVWLQYGATATPIDRPARTFGYLTGTEPRFGTFPSEFITVVDVGLYEEEGKIHLSAVKDRLYRRFANGFEEVDLGDLLEVLREQTLFTEREMRVLVLYGWFDMSAERTAELLKWTPEEVDSELESIEETRAVADRTATITFRPE
ncbi:hypothetical protein [Natrarchaeobaculum aegyptiacum]|uniref:Uncharacterized protein n=1 Tax=Natrarchaeobaculum aegyptiacum TaxID=745377 RepID=A0A2Z2HYG1_9EURY|nr:hypothetical protein [Natrarchaeobaculum aegyptiacum]ARS88568.1 hypothetical protein B1756_01540 [Natrarchaeobaculum aegyptiacum]